jgi:hypothetical protein
MTRVAVLAMLLGALAAGCDDDNTTAPSSQPVVFSALLSPANEVPAVSNVENVGSGAAQITLHTTRGASGAITAATATMYFQLFGFPGDTRVQAAHIHAGGAGVNGPVRVDTGLTPATAISLPDGSTSFTVSNVTVDPAIAEAIIANPGAWYFNAHSPRNPGGVARGQLALVR